MCFLLLNMFSKKIMNINKNNCKSGKERGHKASTQHLKAFNWEIMVVDDPIVNAFCLPGGKIMVFTGLLNAFPSDAEIAIVISHEVWLLSEDC